MRKKCLGLAVLVFIALTIFFASLFLNLERPKEGESEDLLILSRLEIGIAEKVAPCHCSGDRANALFKAEFGKDHVETGVGGDV